MLQNLSICKKFWTSVAFIWCQQSYHINSGCVMNLHTPNWRFMFSPGIHFTMPSCRDPMTWAMPSLPEPVWSSYVQLCTVVCSYIQLCSVVRSCKCTAVYTYALFRCVHCTILLCTQYSLYRCTQRYKRQVYKTVSYNFVLFYNVKDFLPVPDLKLTHIF